MNLTSARINELIEKVMNNYKTKTTLEQLTWTEESAQLCFKHFTLHNNPGTATEEIFKERQSILKSSNLDIIHKKDSGSGRL